MPSKDNIRRFHAALSGAGMMKQKAVILESYGVESTKDLTDEQCAEAIERLNEMKANRYEGASAAIRAKRAIILNLATQLGKYDPHERVSGLRWQSLNRFLQNKRIAGKLLYELSGPELDKLARKLRAMLAKHDVIVDAERRQTILN
jgi:hypothetical protein